MIEGLVAGTLVGMAESRQGKNGSNYVLAKVKAPTTEGDSLIVNAITFASEAGETLLALHEGDALSMTGALTPKVWTDKQGNTRPALDMIATNVLAIRPAGAASDPRAGTD